MDKLLNRVFVAGFYKQYSGLFLLVGLLFIGMCPPGQHWEIFVSIALNTVSNWSLLMIVAVLFFVYFYLIINYIKTTFYQEPYSFLRYSLASLPQESQNKNWLMVLFLTAFPLLFFSGTAIIIGYVSNESLLTSLFFLYIILAFALCFLFIRYLMEPLNSQGKSILLIDFGSRLGNNYTMLGVRQLLSYQRLSYLIAKLLSYIFINVLFFVFSDIQDHKGVVMLILTTIVMGHSSVIAGQFLFEKDDLSLLKNLPFRKRIRWIQIALRLMIMFLPEAVWLLVRYPFIEAIPFLCYLWSFALFLYHLFFLLPPREKYVNWLFFLFFTLTIVSPLAIMMPLAFAFVAFSIVVYWGFDYSI